MRACSGETSVKGVRTSLPSTRTRPASMDLTSEAQAKALAASIGPGVTYVSSMPLTVEKYQGRETLYAFSDVTQLRVSEQPNLPGTVKLPAAAGGSTPPISFALDRKP